MKYMFTFLAFMLAFSIFAQHDHHGHVYDLVSQKQESFRNAKTYSFFGPVAQSASRSDRLSDVIREGTIMQLDVMSLNQARRAENTSFSMIVPRSDGTDFELQLIESTVLSDDFTVFASSNPDIPVDYRPGKHYMGIVDGDKRSVVAVSLFDNHLVGMINTDEGNFVLAQIENTRDEYVLYNDKDLVPEFNLGCEMPDDGKGYTAEELTPQHSRANGDCVRIYVEVHEDITNGKGGVTQATDYVTAVFNQSAILYANDGMNITISEMLVWNTTSPYTSTSTSTLLSQFQSNNGNFNGDLGHLVGYDGSGGIAAGFDGICNSNPDNSMCYSGIQSSYSNVPTYSWTVMVVTHEMGHLFGSRHTHACVWNGNNTAIDGCAGGTEGSCSLPGNPAGGGTIMSYCHQTSVGINMNNGFGPQPSAVVNNNVNNGSCLAPCSSASCDIPGGLNTSGVGDEVATLNWTATSTADDYTVNWRESGASSWNSATTAASSYALSGLSLGTNYEWRVRGNCSGGNSAYSATVSFTTTGSPPAQYCTSTGTNVNYEWIAGVSVADLTNNTGSNGGYGDFTSLSANLASGTAYTMTLTPGFAGTTYSEFWRIWIDYNGDADFDDAGELVAEVNGTSGVNTSFTVPSSGTVASTRMRVSMLWNVYPTACQTFTYGEVEDYTVNIGGSPPSCDAPTGLSSSAITQTTATLSWSSATNADDYNLDIRVQGSSTWTNLGVITGTSTGVTGMTAATTYEWRVNSNCGSSTSPYSSIASFTTDQPTPSCNAPTGLSTSAITESTATLSWSTASNANDYTVQLRVQGSSTWDIEGVIAGTSASATGLVSGTNYEWHVRSNCTGGSSSYSPIATFTTDQSSGGCTYQTINFNDFENGWGIWNDGGSDCRRSSGDASYALGTYCARLRDNTSSSVMTTDNINLTTYDEITVDFSYYPRSMDNSNEDFWLQVSTNGGGSYSTVEEWNRGDEFENNQRYYDQVVMTGTFTSNTRFRFRCDASGNSDWVYIDEVEISGCNNAAIYAPTIQELAPVENQEELSLIQTDELEPVELDQEFLVYPIPVKNELNIEFISDHRQAVEVIMTASNGQVYQTLNANVGQGEQDLTLDVRTAVPGLYVLILVTDDDVMTKMVIVQ